MSNESAAATKSPEDTSRTPLMDRMQAWHRGNREKDERARAAWILAWARSKYWTWTVATKSIITVIYLEIVSQGIIYLFPDMGKRLWKVPFFAILNEFEATHRITLAHVFAIVPLIATWVLWAMILSMYLAEDRFKKKFDRFAYDQSRRVILIIGFVVIVADAGMFGASFSMSRWGSSSMTPTSILATALYCAVIAFVSLISLFLGDQITVLKEKEKETANVQNS